MISNICKILLGAVLASFVSLAWDARPLAENDTSIVEKQKKWTADDVAIMSKSNSMEAAVSLLTNAALETGAPLLQLDEIKARINGKSAAVIRNTIFAVADAKGTKKNKQEKEIAAFARAVDPAATCATAGTAGGNGLDACAAECERSFFFSASDSRKASCHTLCTLAIAPCTEGYFCWRMVAKSWTKSAIEWIAITFQRAWMLMKTVNAMSSSNTTLIVLLLVVLANELRDKPEFRKWRVRVFRSETLRALNGRDSLKVKGSILAITYARLHTKHALFTWHDFSARATYRASQEAAAAKAAKAKAVALQAAIDAVAAEQGARDKDGGACVLS